MKKIKYYIPALALFFIFGHVIKTHAQSEKELLAQLVSEDQDAIDALVLYPEDTRTAILEASLHPEALIKLESVQSQTSGSFSALMDRYTRSTQEIIWDLTRYPGLVHALATVDNGSKKEIKNILQDYPEVIHRRAEEAVQVSQPLLVEIDQLNIAAEAAFNILLADYPARTQTALRKLITLPEVLTILTDNIRLTVLAGDIYKKDSAWVLHKISSFHLEVASGQAEEVADLKASAATYEEEYGYNDTYYEYEYDDLYYDAEVDNVVEQHYYYYNYPYWFGYPNWYYYPRWRLYPLWYDWGFYLGNSGTCIVVNMPSFYFMNWYFYLPHHHHYWPHLSAQFTNHYYGHRAIGTSSINTTVANWKERNREVVTDDWTRDDGRLVERFKEFGKFESAREKYNEAHPQKAQTQKEYLDRNSNRFPKMTEKTERNKVRENDLNKPVPKTSAPETTIPRKKDVSSNRIEPKVNKAKDYHKNTWEKPRSTRPKVQTIPRPKTNTQPKTIKPKNPKVVIPKTGNNKVRKKN